MSRQFNVPTKKLKNGFEIPVFGIGTWRMGRGSDNEDIKAIRSAIEFGVKHIDTAELYENGRVEKLVGKAIRGYDRRKLFITSKE